MHARGAVWAQEQLTRKAKQSNDIKSTETAKAKHKTEKKKRLSRLGSTPLCGYRIKPVDFCVSNNPRWIYRARNKQKPGLFD
jgi:hypothetical protein